MSRRRQLHLPIAHNFVLISELTTIQSVFSPCRITDQLSRYKNCRFIVSALGLTFCVLTSSGQPQHHVDITTFVHHFKFIPVRKKALQYQYTLLQDVKDDLGTMPPMSYTIITDSAITKQNPFIVTTITKDGSIETTNLAKSGDIIMSGPSCEKYVLSPDNFCKFYEARSSNKKEEGDGVYVIPNQSPRFVAKYTHDDRCVTFTAPWGETMLLKPGDYLVKDIGGDGCYYRIAEAEFKETYDEQL
jgi:hypothetical protein